MVPSRAEMERGLAAFADRGGVRVRYGCRWEATRRESRTGSSLETTDGEYRCRAAVFAIGVTDAVALADRRDRARAALRRLPPAPRLPRQARVRRRQAELRLRDRRRPRPLGEAGRALLAAARRRAPSSRLASIRVRYFQPYEDACWGGGTLALDAAIDRIERTSTGWRVHAAGHDPTGRLRARGGRRDRGDRLLHAAPRPPGLGVATVAQGTHPRADPFWESATVPGIYFAGNATQGAAGLRKHGIGGASGTVSGLRYNARVLARHLAETRFGSLGPARPRRPRRRRSLPARRAGARARALEPEGLPRPGRHVRPRRGLPRRGVLPLQHFVDRPGRTRSPPRSR